MFRRILVPLDGSELAERVVPLAARVARASHAQVCLLNVVPLPTSYTPYAITLEATLPLSIERGRERALDYLRRVAASADLENVTTTVGVETGAPASAILDAVAALDADLVVMSTHGRGGLARWVLGSVAQHVARYCPVPALLLRAGDTPDGRAARAPGHPVRVLVPLDGSAAAEAALGPAGELGRALAGPAGFALHLLAVVDPRAAELDCVPEIVALGRAEGYLSGVAAKIEADGPNDLARPVTWSALVDSDIASAILRVAEAQPESSGTSAPAGYDLVAMATHGRSGLTCWALGSVTERVVQGGRLPLLIVRSGAGSQTAANTSAAEAVGSATESS